MIFAIKHARHRKNRHLPQKERKTIITARRKLDKLRKSETNESMSHWTLEPSHGTQRCNITKSGCDGLLGHAKSMKCFHCNSCGMMIFFKNDRCVKCRAALGFLPDVLDLSTLEPAGNNQWRAGAPQAGGRTYRQCANGMQFQACN